MESFIAEGGRFFVVGIILMGGEESKVVGQGKNPSLW